MFLKGWERKRRGGEASWKGADDDSAEMEEQERRPGENCRVKSGRLSSGVEWRRQERRRRKSLGGRAG